MELPEIPLFDFNSVDVIQEWQLYTQSFENIMPVKFQLTCSDTHDFLISKTAMLFLINLCNAENIDTENYENLCSVLNNGIPDINFNDATHIGLLTRVLFEKTNIDVSMIKELILSMSFKAQLELMDSSFLTNELHILNVKDTKPLLDIIVENEYLGSGLNKFRRSSPLAQHLSGLEVSDAILDIKHPLAPFLGVLFRYEHLIAKTKKIDTSFEALIGHNLKNLNRVDSTYFESEKHEACFNLAMFIILNRIRVSCQEAIDDEIKHDGKAFTLYVENTSSIHILNEHLVYYESRLKNNNPELYALIKTQELLGVHMDIEELLHSIYLKVESELKLPEFN